MRRPRSINGYSIQDILNKYSTTSLDDNNFWTAAFKFFGHDQTIDMRSIAADYHSEMVWEAYEHCMDGRGNWTEEDEDEMYMAMLHDISTDGVPKKTNSFFFPLNDEEYAKENGGVFVDIKKYYPNKIKKNTINIQEHNCTMANLEYLNSIKNNKHLLYDTLSRLEEEDVPEQYMPLFEAIIFGKEIGEKE